MGKDLAVKTGPLAGLTVIEMAGIGPVPLAGLMLCELGARVVRVERLAKGQGFLNQPPEFDLDLHGREILRVDLKRQEGVTLLLQLIGKADILLEGFRPGVMERLGLGPDVVLAQNPGLVFGRMTGFGQEGPLSSRAGHDMTYLALTGVLSAIGPKGGKPLPPLNLVADFGGGTMFLVAGVLAAIIEKGRSGKGQVVDAAMVDGASMLAAPLFGFLASGFWQEQRGSNVLDSGTPFYDTYKCADGGYIAVACLEPQFFAEFCRLLPLPENFLATQYDKTCWAQLRAAIESRIAEYPRDHWAALFEDTDACVAPVLSLTEAPQHKHNRARAAHVTVEGGLQRPAPAPRFSRTPAKISQPTNANMAQTLAEFGMDGDEIEGLASAGIIGR